MVGALSRLLEWLSKGRPVDVVSGVLEFCSMMGIAEAVNVKMAAPMAVVSFILGMVCLEMTVIADEGKFKLGGGLELKNMRAQKPLERVMKQIFWLLCNTIPQVSISGIEMRLCR